MAEQDDPGRADVRRALERDLRRLARREESARTFWRSLSALGIVGWSVALPAAGGALLGRWLDQHYETGVHCTLGLLVAGVCLGAMLAWHALRRQGW
jgi:ATP synthase protein I